MRDIFILFLHAIVIIIRLARPGGLRSVVAESVLMRHQVLILHRGRKRAPNLRASDRIIAGLCTSLMRPARVLRSAIALRPSTLMHFHKMLTKQKYLSSAKILLRATIPFSQWACAILSPMSYRSRSCQFVSNIFCVLVDALAFVCLCLRTSSALAAENMFLRKQLGLY